jgi:hypothetical protein
MSVAGRRPSNETNKTEGTMPDLEGHGQLTVQEYQAKAVSADQLRGDDLAIPLLGLFGETGSLLSEAKKKHRDAVSYTGYESTVIEELGKSLAQENAGNGITVNFWQALPATFGATAGRAP